MADLGECDCHRIVEHLQAVSINFVAIDFDMTMIDIHTKGIWRGTAEELCEHVRPFFRTLVPLLAQSGFNLAIATFSPQTEMILEVLHSVFPSFAREIVIRGNDRSWEYTGDGCKKGKQAHMASAVEELFANKNVHILKQTSLLVDDDFNNVCFALDDGVKAIWLDVEHTERLHQKFLDL